MAEVQKVMDRKKIANTIHEVLDKGIEMLGKKKMGKDDQNKIGLIRVLGSTINAGVAMVQQETSQERIQVIRERMAQLGFGSGSDRKQLPSGQ